MPRPGASPDRIQSIWGKSESISPSNSRSRSLEATSQQRVAHEAVDLLGLWDPTAAAQETRSERQAEVGTAGSSHSPPRPATAGTLTRSPLDERGHEIRAKQLAEERYRERRLRDEAEKYRKRERVENE